MYVVWFKLYLGGFDIKIEVASIEQARDVYDAAVDAGWYAMQVRP